MEKVAIQKQILLSYKDIYEEDKFDLFALLKNIPRTPGVEFISYLLHLYNVRKKDNSRFQSNHLIQWMMQMKGKDQQNILNFIIKNEKLINDPYFKLLDRRPCLDLIQHILVYSNAEDSTVLNADNYTSLFKCLLHFNEIEVRVQEKIFNWDGIGSINQFADYILTVDVRNIEHERFKNYILQFLKVYYFFVFCESHEKYSLHLNFFLESLGLASYKSYLWKLLSPYLKLMVSEEPTPKMYVDNEPKSLNFYKRLTINEKIVSIDEDYKPLRQYPLFETENNMYLFMDFRFFVDKFYQGFLFDFAATTKISYGNLKTDMGNEFSEHVLFYTIMDKCFSKYGNVRLTGEQIKSKISSGEPDYYIRKGADIFLFEFKDIITLTANIKHSGNSDEIKKRIAEQLERNTDGKRKGITQLLNTIKEIQLGIYKEKNIDQIPTDETIVYPIIVHTDITLESSGINYFLNERMRELIIDFELSDQKIKNLILMNLDTLIQLQDHFIDGKLDLADCINSYISYISSNDPVTVTFPFDEFVKYYFVEKNKESIGNPKEFKAIIAAFEREVKSNQ